MSDDGSPPGWPASPGSGDGTSPPWTPGPDATAAGSAPPPAGPPPGGYAPPFGATPPNVPPPPGYGPPNVPPAPGYGYGSPGYGYGGYPVARDHPQGTTILVLGILSLVACGLLGPVAWIMGNKAIKEIDANPAAYTNRSNVQTGRVIGIVATCLMIVGVLFYGLLVVVVFAGSSTS